MITKSQQKWLDHLSSTDKITIKPYDPNSPKIFEEVKNKVVKVLGKVRVLHRGASYLKISGQDEIDIYVPVSPKKFDETIEKMRMAFGPPGSLYPLVRARFPIKGYNKHVDVFVINKEDKGWLECEIFTRWLMNHPDDLQKYKHLKENGMGLSTKDYYTEKKEFINRILKMTKLF